jgi:histidinol-phosphatase (PHP family)
MRVKTDYHVHPDYSVDAEAVKIREYCQGALELGIEEICFTTHLEFGAVEQGKDKIIYYKGKRWNIFDWEWLDGYFDEIDRAEKEFKSSGLSVKRGIEIGYLPNYLEEIEKVVNEYPFDFVLGGIHFIDGYFIASKIDCVDYFKTRSLETVGNDYFSMLGDMVESGLFDSVAHIDIYSRYGIRYFGKRINNLHKGRIEPILREIAQRNMGIEINTSSISRGLAEFHPTKEIISLAVQAGVKIFTVGSDAHELSTLGEYIDEALDMLDEFGLHNYIYEKRKALHAVSAR